MTSGKWWYNFRTRHGVAMCTFFVGLAPTHAFIMHAAVCAGTIWRKSWCLLKGNFSFSYAANVSYCPLPSSVFWARMAIGYFLDYAIASSY